MAHIFIKTAWGYIRRSPFQAMAAIFVLSITFFVTTILSMLVYGSHQTIRYYETKPEIITFLKDDVPVESIAELRARLVADERLKDVVYVSKEDALEIYKEATSDKPLLTELVSPAIFPASLEFSVTELEYAKDIIQELQTEEVVDEIGFTASFFDDAEDAIDRIKTVGWYIRIGGGGFAAVQLVASMLVLMIVITMRLSARKSEIEILDLLGATTRFVRSPIILEALLYAFWGVLLGWIAALTLTLYLTPSIISYFGDIPVLPRETSSLLVLFGVLLAVELAIGFFLALLGSTLAIRRAHKRK